MVPTSKKSSKKTVRSTLPAEGVVLNFRIGDDGCFHSINAAFDSGVKWWTYVSSRHNLKQKVIAILMVMHEMFQADRHALFLVCRGQLSRHPSC
ncbi:hypothetical protein TNCT_8301 [Trichonephila clavata]|uniref:Uncharacterized protein n=1 Tax=Trichonephila clavata TaxID=2740835 RepID=A0A8X6LH07_TRICU|nr:hypothetical protein TNCT_8301 [Trichonephila clavata]